MNKKRLQELHAKSKQELQKELHTTREKLWNLKNDLASGKVKNVKEIRAMKKLIARILTFINE